MANKLHIRRDDTVVVISEVKIKAKWARCCAPCPKPAKVIVENVNVVARHTKPSGQGQPGGIIRSEGAIFASR